MLGSSYVISLSCAMLEYKMISVAPSLSIFLLVNTNVPSIVSAKCVVPICVVPQYVVPWCQDSPKIRGHRGEKVKVKVK